MGRGVTEAREGGGGGTKHRVEDVFASAHTAPVGGFWGPGPYVVAMGELRLGPGDVLGPVRAIPPIELRAVVQHLGDPLHHLVKGRNNASHRLTTQKQRALGRQRAQGHRHGVLSKERECPYPVPSLPRFEPSS